MLLLPHNQVKDFQKQCGMSEDVFDMSSEPTEGNSVEQLGVLGDLKSLEVLNLARNQLTKLCINEFMGNYNLKQLNMTQNRIRTIAKSTFSFVQDLTMLDLSMNMMDEFSFFTELPNIEELYLQYNQIIGVGDPGVMTMLKKIDLSFNKWNCDCNLKQFVNFMREPGEVIEVVGRTASTSMKDTYFCTMPLMFMNRELNVLQSQELTCEKDLPPEDELPAGAIMAPISIVAILVIVIIIVFCASKNRRVRNKHRQFGRVGHTNHADEHVVASGGVNAKNIIKNDAAILCHVNSQKWVIDIMLPTLKQKPQQSKLRCEKLYIDVFTIKSQV